MKEWLYRKALRPLLFQFDAETAHHLAMFALAHLPLPVLRLLGEENEAESACEIFGLRFANRVGLAAGFDKNALVLPAWEALGFGFIEAGTITAQAQPGNPRPRLFRYPKQRALINRMGFNNDGAEAIAARLEALKESGNWPKSPVGLNLGKSKTTPLAEATADYLTSLKRLFLLGDYFVLNVSSPNTPGLRQLQDKAALDELLREVQKANTERSRGEGRIAAKPLLLKIAPDLEFAQIEEILVLVEAHRLAGIIATNTSLDHSAIATRDEQGGLSGEPLRAHATEIVRFISSKSAVPIVASGGVMDAESAREKFDAGASLVQIYTGFIYRGPSLIAEICRTWPR